VVRTQGQAARRQAQAGRVASGEQLRDRRAAGAGAEPASAGCRAGASLASMATSHADLGRIRDQATAALDRFLGQQRAVLDDIGPDLVPWLDAIGDLLAGGKRLRPAFCYWGWRGAGGDDCGQIHAAAAAVELLHASALVHDDVMDASDTRRGRPSVHRRFAALHAAQGWRGSADTFGTGAAILIGDLLLAWTDQLYQASDLPQDALRRGQPMLDSMRTEVICGQYLDLLAQSAGDGAVATALRVVRYKSAKYTVERPLQLGVALAGPADPAPLLAACTEYGIPVGVAFQLRDDLLGVFGDPARTGKPAGDDLREGKQTVLVAMARQRASAAQRELLDRCLGDQLLDEAGADEVRAVLTETGAVAECERMIDACVADALSVLRHARVCGEARQALAELAVTATARSG
jgi:geranylgeranyl diphosphate synthase, type I